MPYDDEDPPRTRRRERDDEPRPRDRRDRDRDDDRRGIDRDDRSEGDRARPEAERRFRELLKTCEALREQVEGFTEHTAALEASVDDLSQRVDGLTQLGTSLLDALRAASARPGTDWTGLFGQVLRVFERSQEQRGGGG